MYAHVAAVFQVLNGVVGCAVFLVLDGDVAAVFHVLNGDVATVFHVLDGDFTAVFHNEINTHTSSIVYNNVYKNKLSLFSYLFVSTLSTLLPSHMT